MSRRSQKFNGVLAVFLAIVFVAVGGFGGYVGYLQVNTLDGQVYTNGSMQVHFMELGNDKAGDCTYIKAGDVDILIDGGSNYDSVDDISSYINQYVTDGVLEYVIVTHADLDHIACFAGSSNNPSLFELYECEIIIDFALTNKDTNAYNKYVENRDAEIAAGAAHYTAAECINENKNVFDLGGGVELEILDSYYYHNRSSDENEHSVCVMINQGERHFLFTGDLEEKGEEKLVQMNDLPEVELYKAGHHGSKTSSSSKLMAEIRP
jgi:competence protein ComEC